MQVFLFMIVSRAFVRLGPDLIWFAQQLMTTKQLKKNEQHSLNSNVKKHDADAATLDSYF